ncbi:HDL353Wp [Eremothecium sinecaudum]|uniref:DNA polymerase epsilon subunit B n=1 Tax=Eremothecium sinecaudum TaxID=45286 RepID=A0A0X8HS14_9SACH|nr:HDL353Wp [Eremothecium sinecaudum]AMD20391.1 HDL353Wp [Eremothecium sinecaudum]
MNKGTVLPVEISPQLLRPLAYRVLSKKYGLNIKSDGLTVLAKFIGRTFGIDWRKSPDTMKFLEKFATVWREQERGIFVDGEGSEEVTRELIERSKATKERSKQVIKQAGGQVVNNKTLDAYIKDKSRAQGLQMASDGEKDNDEVDLSSQVALSEGSRSTSPVLEAKRMQGVPAIDDDPENLNILDEDIYGTSSDELQWTDYFKVINCFTQQRFTYDASKKRYRFIRTKVPPDASGNPSVTRIKVPSVQSNISLFQTRYHIVKDRVLRNPQFQNDDKYNPLFSMSQLENQLKGNAADISSNMYISITQIKNLLGRNGKNFLLLGLIRKNSKDVWSLEDPSGTVELDISEALPTKGLFYVPGFIVLVEGIYYSVGNKFRVSSITHPPGERREETLEAIGNLDLLGIHGPSNEHYVARLDKELKIRLHLLERELTDHRFVFLGGNIYLDEISTFGALKKVFNRLEEDPPTVVVLCGSFSSTPLHPSMNSRNVTAVHAYRNNFDTLAALLSEYENLINETTFIFVPGGNDPWSSMVSMGVAGTLPQKPIPGTFTGKINRICKKIIWASNPTRIAYLSQEIVISRDDITARFKRNNIIFPTVEEEQRAEYLSLQRELQAENQDPDLSISQMIKSRDQLPATVQESRKIIKTILDQQHLSPFTAQLRPIVWDLDYTLQLTPIPSTLVICDNTAPNFEATYNGCKTINPGAFIHKRTARYMEFIPSTRKVIEEEVIF